MPLSLRIISSPDGEPVSEWTKVFPEEGGNIGRSYGSTMQLSDASRAISGTHVIINRGSRGYQVMDVSTNGLFINGNHQALGKNNSASLNDGDVLDLGHYRLMASCFVPEKAMLKSSVSTESSLGEWGDDPFGNEDAMSLKKGLSTQNNSHVNLSFSAFSEPTTPDLIVPQSIMPKAVVADSVERDPFIENQSAVTPTLEPEHINQFNDESFDDDPFISDKTEQLNTVSISNYMRSSMRPSEVATPTGIDPQQIIALQADQQDIMIQAVEMAFGRLMEDIAPTNLEAMFKDLIQPSIFSRKPDYWEMYKRYFQRQHDNQDWQLKFKAYFSESLRIKQSLGKK